ncbi:hypothetical protein H312_01204 [Anncaliia algerae PRA339]|uniref:Uncharacterized protein n=1 Tax=Anncaliia algerae PRA339 TaxID=1288291 RepID=A0A059F295_9MICR|nr:hypothetical protein H312_01204 [Anncaliia algerae PRA339]
MFQALYLIAISSRLITHKETVVNLAGFPEKQIILENNRNVIVRKNDDIWSNRNFGNLLYVIPIGHNRYYIKFDSENYLFLNSRTNVISTKRLNYIKGTMNYDEGFEWKIHETLEGLKFESSEKCIQVFSSNKSDEILYLRATSCTNNLAQLFEMIEATIRDDFPELYINTKGKILPDRNNKEPIIQDFVINDY